jgi:hypothetical protein
MTALTPEADIRRPLMVARQNAGNRRSFSLAFEMKTGVRFDCRNTNQARKDPPCIPRPSNGSYISFIHFASKTRIYFWIQTCSLVRKIAYS